MARQVNRHGHARASIKTMATQLEIQNNHSTKSKLGRFIPSSTGKCRIFARISHTHCVALDPDLRRGDGKKEVSRHTRAGGYPVLRHAKSQYFNLKQSSTTRHIFHTMAPVVRRIAYRCHFPVLKISQACALSYAHNVMIAPALPPI